MTLFFLNCVQLCLLLLSLPTVRGSCYFQPTNQTLPNVCDLSEWMTWNCTCSGSDVNPLARLAVRQRGICCDKNETISLCKNKCGYNVTRDIDFDQCGTPCADKITPSSCIGVGSPLSK